MTRVHADFLLRHAAAVVSPVGPAPLAGRRQRELRAVPDGAVAARDGRIVFVGPTSASRDAVEMLPGARIVDAGGCTVLPGFVDAHTHAVYAGDRSEELRRRLGGASYAEIAAAGGGIVATVRATRAARVEELVAASLPRLWELLLGGTTTCEIKSGYGLDVESEIRMLRAIHEVASRCPVDVVPTFLGAHEIPVEWRSDRAGFVDQVISVMIPRVAAEGLASWCDVFCEDGVFSPEESRRILDAGRRAGLAARIHADELAASGGARVAAAVGARSADHLVHVDAGGIAALAESGTVATLLPAASLYLKLGRFAPARALIEAGVPVALGSDVNPGGGLSPSMPFAMTLACFAMGLTLEEAVVAATLNAAYSLDRDGACGSLEPGKLMDAVVVRGALLELLRVGAPSIALVVKGGRVVVEEGRHVAGPTVP